MSSQLDAKTSQTMKALTSQGEEKSRFFFIRRIPLRHVPREWKRPPDQQYQQDLLYEGFITEAVVRGNMSDPLAVDVRELEQYLLPHFWRVNQLAKFYQNRLYQYQWSFILSAFFTTALAAVNVFFYAQGWEGGWGTGTFLGAIRPTEVLGLLTAIISGIATAVSFLDANQTPQKRWFKARAQAAGLRSLYFLYIARQKPFDIVSDRERVHKMRETVLDVLRDRTGAAPPRAASPTLRPDSASAANVSEPQSPRREQP